MGFLDTINTKLIDLLGPFGPLIAILMLGVLLICKSNLIRLISLRRTTPHAMLPVGRKSCVQAKAPINWTNIPAFWNQKTKKNILRSN
jgi:hypothetical protein